MGSSPHTRGALCQLVGGGAAVRIIPAYAGSTPAPSTSPAGTSDHPRIRGEHVLDQLADAAAHGSSPHTRGARGTLPASRAGPRIIPAYAGSTPDPAPVRWAGRDHPRIRGEHELVESPPHDHAGSSPHTRGAPGYAPSQIPGDGIIPAYAGSTRPMMGLTISRWDHPRIRGEHETVVMKLLKKGGSSPHTRGAPSTLRRSRRPSRIIPAYAGSTLDRPLIRGRLLGSSPHTRGAQPCGHVLVRHRRIIPAYAGSTSIPYAGVQHYGDHPRIRGEHVFDNPGKDNVPGSSPHTRGAPEARGAGSATTRIIPAYAGSTVDTMTMSVRSRDHPRIRGEHVVAEDDAGLAGGIIPAYAGSTNPCRQGRRL